MMTSRQLNWESIMEFKMSRLTCSSKKRRMHQITKKMTMNRRTISLASVSMRRSGRYQMEIRSSSKQLRKIRTYRFLTIVEKLRSQENQPRVKPSPILIPTPYQISLPGKRTPRKGLILLNDQKNRQKAKKPQTSYNWSRSTANLLSNLSSVTKST